MKQSKKPTIAERISAGMKEIEAFLQSGEPLEKHFTVRTIEIPDPDTFDAKRVERLIKQLGMSQAVFAGFIGVSVKLVEAWLAGSREPSLLARRLLALIEHDPKAFLKSIRASAA